MLTEEASHRPRIIIGKDTRLSGDMLECALAAGLCSVGAEVMLVDVVPTPTIAYLTRLYEADAGIMISASHNPMEYNGIKFFNSRGFKLDDATEDRIADLIEKGAPVPLATGTDIGKVIHKFDAVTDYITFAKSTIPTDLKGLSIAIDCANGAASFTAREVLEELGATVFSCCDQPDGCNINNGCGSTHIERLQQFVLQSGANAGLAFDGDADRVLAVDELGNVVDGDKIMAICALDMKERDCLKDNTLVVTVMSNLGLFMMAEQHGIQLKKTRVGDRYVLEELVKGGYSIGGEQSGHVIVLEHNTTGDGLVTGLQLLAVLKQSNRTLSDLASVMQVMPQVLVNARVRTEHKNSYAEDPAIAEELQKIEREFAGRGRVLIRPSGTEPLVRVMIEGEDIDLITRRAEALAALIEAKLG